MSDHEGDSRWMGPFLAGFVLGVLVCLGAGGSLVWAMNARVQMERLRAEEQARAAEQMAVDARQAEAQARQRAEEHALEARRQRQAAEQRAEEARKALEDLKQIREPKDGK